MIQGWRESWNREKDNVQMQFVPRKDDEVLSKCLTKLDFFDVGIKCFVEGRAGYIALLLFCFRSSTRDATDGGLKKPGKEKWRKRCASSPRTHPPYSLIIK